MSDLLNSLYREYSVYNYSFGAVHDKLGDVYEEYCVRVLRDSQYLYDIKNGIFDTLEHNVLYSFLRCFGFTNMDCFDRIDATSIIPHRNTGGNSKTDIIATVITNDNPPFLLNFPISCKQSTARKVALAEFDVATICDEMGITDRQLIDLLKKHQADCSAKNFTADEKHELTRLMSSISRDFVRWVLTGSPESRPDDLCIPILVIKFKLCPPTDRHNINIHNGDFAFVSFETLSIEECIDRIMYTSSGKLKSGGFGTGLSWTYATGSMGQKMQFKG